jgi:hypothetical protein
MVFECINDTNSDVKCINDYANQNGLQFINVPADGDCFFHTLLLYYSRRGIAPPRPTILALRKAIVDYILANWDSKYVNFSIDKGDVEKLRNPRSWAGGGGDLVADAAANVFGMTINLYDVHDAIPAREGRNAIYNNTGKRIRSGVEAHPAVKKHINRHEFVGGGGAGEVINIARIGDNHFGLLVPKPAAAAAAPVATRPVRRRPQVAPSAAANPAAAPPAVGRPLRRRAQVVSPPPPIVAPTQTRRRVVAPPQAKNKSKINVNLLRALGANVSNSNNNNAIRAIAKSLGIEGLSNNSNSSSSNSNSNSSSSSSNSNSNNGSMSPNTKEAIEEQQKLLNYFAKLKLGPKKP